jgi:hypothetical protein
MRTSLWVGIVGGLALWVAILYRRLEAARLRGDMYRDVAARLDRRIVEQSNQER